MYQPIGSTIRENVCVSQYKDIDMWHILIAVFIFNPGFYVAIIPYFAAIAGPEMAIGHSLHPISDFVTCWLLASNSFWNAIIYMLTMRSFREALFKIPTDMRTKLARWHGYTDTDNRAVGRTFRGAIFNVMTDMQTRFSSTAYNLENTKNPDNGGVGTR